MDSCSKFALLGLADYHDKNENYQKASVYYEKLIACDSTYFPVYLNYGVSFYEAGDHNNALIQFSKYLKYIKEDPTVYRYVGLIYQQNGDSLTGEKFLNRVEELKKLGRDSIKHVIIIE
jgi:tetratricopeptide (TPR) repeat protein